MDETSTLLCYNYVVINMMYICSLNSNADLALFSNISFVTLIF